MNDNEPISLKELYEIRARGQLRGIPSASRKRDDLETVSQNVKAYVTTLNRSFQDVPELGMYSSHSNEPVFPLTFLPIRSDNETGFQVAGTSSMIDVRTGTYNGTPDVTFSFLITARPKTPILDEANKRLIFAQRTTYYPREIITGKKFDEEGFFNFQRAMIIMTLAEGDMAQCGKYNVWPGKGMAQIVASVCLPPSLKPESTQDMKEGHANLLQKHEIDAPLLPLLQEQIGQIRKGHNRKTHDPFKNRAREGLSPSLD